ncbi:MAG: hypothetical protein Q7S43_02215 [bacterium]|nr:hypothetical protein [bacterium]
MGPFIENCFCLTPKRVDDTLNRIGRKIGDDKDIQRADIRYEYDQVGEQYYKVVIVDGNEPQRILTETLETDFGEREYFRCNKCDSRCHKLFLLPGGHIFLCKKCHGVKYQKFNTSSRHGRLFDRTRKVIRLVNEQATMSPRIFYKSAYTRRYSKFLDDCLKVGLTDIVADARALESAIKANN